MTSSLALTLAAIALPTATLPTALWQVAPDLTHRVWWDTSSRTKDHAVLLIPGLKLHPLRPGRVTRPEMHDWQEPKSELVRTLARDADVFAFGYAQIVSLDMVAQSPGLLEAVSQLRRNGYERITLIGHSAGAVIARLFVETHIDSGVTKVIQVAAPNLGSEFAHIFKTGYPKVQAPFIQSLAPLPRQEQTRTSPKIIDPKLEIVCVVCKLPKLKTDGLVPLNSQWPEDLRHQGVPAARMIVSHFEAMRASSSIRTITEFTREPLVRWNNEQVLVGEKAILRD